MAKQPKHTKGSNPEKEPVTGSVADPQASYVPKAVKGSTAKHPGAKRYDAKRYTGMIPGLAERMKDYMKHVRDDR